MNKAHVIDVNRYIPDAVHIAMKKCSIPDSAGRTGRDHFYFDIHYLEAMNKLTIAAGLRLTIEQLFQMKGKEDDSNGK